LKGIIEMKKIHILKFFLSCAFVGSVEFNIESVKAAAPTQLPTPSVPAITTPPGNPSVATPSVPAVAAPAITPPLAGNPSATPAVGMSSAQFTPPVSCTPTLSASDLTSAHSDAAKLLKHFYKTVDARSIYSFTESCTSISITNPQTLGAPFSDGAQAYTFTLNANCFSGPNNQWQTTSLNNVHVLVSCDPKTNIKNLTVDLPFCQVSANGQQMYVTKHISNNGGVLQFTGKAFNTPLPCQ
jgi:hypothetical protein